MVGRLNNPNTTSLTIHAQYLHIKNIVFYNTKHHKSAKLPWHHNIKLSFWSFCHSDQMSEGSQVSKFSLCVKIVKWESVMKTTKGRYGAARAAKNSKNGICMINIMYKLNMCWLFVCMNCSPIFRQKMFKNSAWVVLFSVGLLSMRCMSSPPSPHWWRWLGKWHPTLWGHQTASRIPNFQILQKPTLQYTPSIMNHDAFGMNQNIWHLGKRHRTLSDH